ncbi:hypothetical protein CNR22_17955 [Sphingobacteriaceae bacterium]|nr:hypothetical protein CNR22_17955 [Sphingobacteriaceae bacterium]
MHFDYTYIILFGFQIFEPMVLVTNTIFFILCVLYFARLNKLPHLYAKQMAWFMLMLGTSSVFGAVGHAVHMQMGDIFFNVIVFFMNAFSLLSIYFCFRAAYTYFNLQRLPKKKYIYVAMAYVLILLVVSAIVRDFTIIKVHAGIVLVYSLIVHYLVYRRSQEKGSQLVVLGILLSFLPIIVHSLHFSIDEWFNYKDIAHTIMIISLIVIYKGAYKISRGLPSNTQPDPASRSALKV